MKDCKLTPEQERAIEALNRGAYIRVDNKGMYTANGMLFRWVGARTLDGMIKKQVVKLVEHDDGFGGTHLVYVKA